MVSPTLAGKLKKIIMLAVILLSIDHCANNATPTMAKIEEAKTEKALKSTLQINAIATRPASAKRTSKTF
jgi:hypothetical protein